MNVLVYFAAEGIERKTGGVGTGQNYDFESLVGTYFVFRSYVLQESKQYKQSMVGKNFFGLLHNLFIVATKQRDFYLYIKLLIFMNGDI